MTLCIGPTIQNYLFAESHFLLFKAKKSTTLPINTTQKPKAFEKFLFKVKRLVLFTPKGKLSRAGPNGDTPFVNCLTSTPLYHKPQASFPRLDISSCGSPWQPPPTSTTSKINDTNCINSIFACSHLCHVCLKHAH